MAASKLKPGGERSHPGKGKERGVCESRLGGNRGHGSTENSPEEW